MSPIVLPRNHSVSSLQPEPVVLMCADVVGFSEMTKRLGDKTCLKVMRRLARSVRAVVAAHEGREIEIFGDCFLLELPSAEQAATCAIDLHYALMADASGDGCEPVEMRIAIHAGRALRDGNAFFGRDVIVPFRLFPLAGPGQVAISEAAAAQLPECWRGFVPVRERMGLKGSGEELRFGFLTWSAYDFVSGGSSERSSGGGLAELPELGPAMRQPLHCAGRHLL